MTILKKCTVNVFQNKRNYKKNILWNNKDEWNEYNHLNLMFLCRLSTIRYFHICFRRVIQSDSVIQEEIKTAFLQPSLLFLITILHRISVIGSYDFCRFKLNLWILGADRICQQITYVFVGIENQLSSICPS